MEVDGIPGLLFLHGQNHACVGCQLVVLDSRAGSDPGERPLYPSPKPVVALVTGVLESGQFGTAPKLA